MSKFNIYAKRLDEMARNAFEELTTAAKKYKAAEQLYNNNKRPYGVWNADAATVAKYARIEADYTEAKAEYEKLRRSLYDDKRGDITKIRRELEKELSDYFAASPAALDTATLELIKSGILSPEEYERLMDSAAENDNITMVRLIGRYAMETADNTMDRTKAQKYRVVGYKSNNYTEKPYLEAFDVIANCFERCINNPGMVDSWDNITGKIVESF